MEGRACKNGGSGFLSGGHGHGHGRARTALFLMTRGRGAPILVPISIVFVAATTLLWICRTRLKSRVVATRSPRPLWCARAGKMTICLVRRDIVLGGVHLLRGSVGVVVIVSALATPARGVFGLRRLMHLVTMTSI